MWKSFDRPPLSGASVHVACLPLLESNALVILTLFCFPNMSGYFTGTTFTHMVTTHKVFALSPMMTHFFSQQLKIISLPVDPKPFLGPN